MAVIEFARNVLGITRSPFNRNAGRYTRPGIDLMEDQKKITVKGGTMRLGRLSLCDMKRARWPEKFMAKP